MRIKIGHYEADNSDLAIDIFKIRYQSDKYAKVKATLYNKKNGIIYETKNYKLMKDLIKHWRLK